MKIPRILLFATALLCISTPLRAAQVPKLETLLAEYKKARADVLGKLNEAYALRAEALASQSDSIPDLDGADRARSFAQRLRNPDERNDAIGTTGSDKPTDPLTMLQTEYARARAENLDNVYTFYSTTAESFRRELLRSNDRAGASVMTAFLQKIKPAGATPTASPGLAKKSKTSSK
jgi:hypothetical protein